MIRVLVLVVIRIALRPRRRGDGALTLRGWGRFALGGEWFRFVAPLLTAVVHGLHELVDEGVVGGSGVGRDAAVG